LDRFTEVELAVRVENPPPWAAASLQSLSVWHPLGGERRLVHWRTADDKTRWDCPEQVQAALDKTDQVTMILVTPAIFSAGWRPGWLTDELTGIPPCGGPTLKLVSVCVRRWRAISGWSYETGG